jgi:hypothetical protein
MRERALRARESPDFASRPGRNGLVPFLLGLLLHPGYSIASHLDAKPSLENAATVRRPSGTRQQRERYPALSPLA